MSSAPTKFSRSGDGGPSSSSLAAHSVEGFAPKNGELLDQIITDTLQKIDHRLRDAEDGCATIINKNLSIFLRCLNYYIHFEDVDNHYYKAVAQAMGWSVYLCNNLASRLYAARKDYVQIHGNSIPNTASTLEKTIRELTDSFIYQHDQGHGRKFTSTERRRSYINATIAKWIKTKAVNPRAILHESPKLPLELTKDWVLMETTEGQAAAKLSRTARLRSGQPPAASPDVGQFQASYEHSPAQHASPVPASHTSIANLAPTPKLKTNHEIRVAQNHVLQEMVTQHLGTIKKLEGAAKLREETIQQQAGTIKELQNTVQQLDESLTQHTVTVQQLRDENYMFQDNQHIMIGALEEAIERDYCRDDPKDAARIYAIENLIHRCLCSDHYLHLRNEVSVVASEVEKWRKKNGVLKDNQDQLIKALKEEIEHTNGSSGFYLDLAKGAAIRDLIERVVSKYGARAYLPEHPWMMGFIVKGGRDKYLHEMVKGDVI